MPAAGLADSFSLVVHDDEITRMTQVINQILANIVLRCQCVDNN